MIGLMFYGAIGLWVLIAFYLGRKLPRWFKLKPTWAWLFVPLVFIAPVWDEVIAWPQMQMLCRNVDGYKFAEGMDEKSAAGRTVRFEIETNPFKVFPPTIHLDRRQYLYVDSTTRELVFESTTYVVRRSLIGHIVGGYILRSFFLNGCIYDGDGNQKAILNYFKKLNITLMPTP